MQITLNDFLRILNNSDRLRIVKGGETKYVGYLGNFKQDKAELTGAEEVKKFHAVPEITHKQWKGKGLRPPIQPEETAQYSFSDLQMSLYYTIHI